jgi:hypothetical protein
MADTGRQFSVSVKVFHNLMLYLRLPDKEVFTSTKKGQTRLRKGTVDCWERHNRSILACVDHVIITIALGRRGAALLTFIVKPVDTIDGGALVVSAENKKVLWVFDLGNGSKRHG